MKVLIDGDSLVYTIGFASQKNIWQVFDVDEPELIHFENESKSLCLSFIEDQEGSLGVLDVSRRIEVSPVEHAFHSIKVILQKIAARAKANSYKIYLTGPGNFRESVATIMGYKHNRLDAEKPQLYQEIRDYLVNTHKATIVSGMEADDALSIVYQRSVSGDPVNVSADPNHPVYRHPDECVIAAIDKDLRNIPGKHINFDKRVAENDEYKFVVITEEEGRRSFWKQVLTGDSSDNILGIPGMGPKKADAILDKVTSQSEEDYFWAVYGAYKEKYGIKPFEYYRYDAYTDTTDTFRKRELKPASEILPEQKLVGTALTYLLENARLLWMLRVAPNAEGTHWWMPPVSFDAIAIEDEAEEWAKQGMEEDRKKQEEQGFATAEVKTEDAYADKGIDKPWSEGRGKWFAVTDQGGVKILIGPLGTKKKVQAALKDLKEKVADSEEESVAVASEPAAEQPVEPVVEDTQIGNEDTQTEYEPIDRVYYNLHKDNMWGFYSEDFTGCYGPYDSEQEARDGLAAQIQDLAIKSGEAAAEAAEVEEVVTSDELVTEPTDNSSVLTNSETQENNTEREETPPETTPEVEVLPGSNEIWDTEF